MFARRERQGEREEEERWPRATRSSSIDEFEEMEGSGGATWRLARKTLGAESFGFNVVDIEPGGQIPEHDHTGDNQEEVFIILDGQGTIVADGEEHDAPAGHLLPLRARGEAHDPQQLGRDRPRAADRRPGRQRLRADALGLGMSVICRKCPAHLPRCT